MAQPTCEVAQACGGCPMIEQSLAAQRALKTARVLEVFQQVAEPPPDRRWVGSPRADAYRNRVRMRLERGLPRFFNEHKIRSCTVLTRSLQAAMTRFESWAASAAALLEPYDHVEIRESDLDGLAGLEVSASVDVDHAHLAEELRSSPLPGFTCWIRGEGPPTLQRFEIVPGIFSYVPLGSFRQINAGVNARMVEVVGAWLDALGTAEFGDMYCGSGNLSLPLLVSGRSGWGVERDGAAIDALRRAAKEQHLDASRFVSGDAAQAAQPAEVLLLDPPRAGLGAATPVVGQIRPSYVVLFSCSSRGLRRDLDVLYRGGYRPLRVALCDMFVHTDHLEVVTLLGLRGSSA